jgi:hypothetical protein
MVHCLRIWMRVTPKKRGRAHFIGWFFCHYIFYYGKRFVRARYLGIYFVGEKSNCTHTHKYRMSHKTRLQSRNALPRGKKHTRECESKETSDSNEIEGERCSWNHFIVSATFTAGFRHEHYLCVKSKQKNISLSGCVTNIMYGCGVKGLQCFMNIIAQ